MMVGYYSSGEFLRQLAERVTLFKLQLAKGGYWTGGRAPYGFGRVLERISKPFKDNCQTG